MAQTRGRGLVLGLLVGALVLDATYWSIWFTHREWLASESTRAYFDFENAFPLADLWLGVACVLALATLLLRRPSALLWLICAGAAGLYLGCMDLLYDVENGIFGKGAGGLIELGVVVVTWLFSLIALTWAWRHRGALLSS